MSIGLISAAYVVAAILFILALGGLSNQEKAKRAIYYGIIYISLVLIFCCARVLMPGMEIDPDRTPWGRVESGYSADLLLVARNPLSEISATEEIEGVALAGRWYSREDLLQLEQRLRDQQGSLLPLAQLFEDAVTAGDVAAAREAVDAASPDLGDDTLISDSNCIFLGYRFYYGGQRDLAGRLYEVCAEMHPESAPLWWHIGQAREDGDFIEGAIQAYSRALEISPWYR